MAAFNLRQYVKNVSMSAGYVMKESLKEYNPVISQFADTNKDAVKEITAAVGNYKKILREGKEAAANSEYTKIAKETVSNILEDLKTGKFYNKERAQKAEESMTASFMGDFDMSFDDSFDDWNNIDEDFGSDGDNDSLTLSGMDGVGERIATATGRAVIHSTDYAVKAGRANTKTILAHADILFGQVNASLSGLNSTLGAVGKAIAEPALTHYDNSTKFYQTSTEELAKQTGYLTQIYELLDKRFNPKKEDRYRSNKRKSYEDVVGYDGVVDLKSYMEVIKENIKENSYVSIATSMMSMMDGVGGLSGMLRSSLHSPIASLMKMGTSGLIGKTLGKEFKNFNRTLAGVFPSLLIKLKKKEKESIGGPWGFLAEILGIKQDKRRGVDRSKYEKGRVDWTGKDDKALREVIPTQLAMILSAITGQEPKIFDYETGKWTTYTKIQNSFKKKVKSVSRSATRDIQDQMEKNYLESNEAKSRGITSSSAAYYTFKHDMENFFHYLTINNERMPFNDKEWMQLRTHFKNIGYFHTNGKPGGMMLESNFNKIRGYFKKNAKNNRGLNMQLSGNLMSGNSNLSKMYEGIENDTESSYGLLFSNSPINSAKGSGYSRSGDKIKNHPLTRIVDDKGNSIFYYLQQFFINLERISDNTAGGNFGGGGGGKRGKRSGTTTNTKKYEVKDNSEPEFKSSSNDEERWTDTKSKAASKGYSRIQKDTKSDVEKAKDNIENWMKNNKYLKRMGKTGELIAGLISGPTSMVRRYIDKADTELYKFFFGEHADSDAGILGQITQGFKDTFNSLKTSLKDAAHDILAPLGTVIGDRIAGLFGFKNMGELMKEGIWESNLMQGVRGNLKSAGKWMKDSIFETADHFTGGGFSRTVSSVMGKVKDFRAKKEAGNAARGGLVTKSGMVSVSEGEMIIPSEKNPYYRGKTDKSAQESRERYNASRWLARGGNEDDYWGNYARGSKRVKKKKNRSLVREYKEKKRDLEEGFRKTKTGAKRTFNEARDVVSGTIEDTMADIRDTEAYQKMSAVTDMITGRFKHAGITLIDRLFGKQTDKNGRVLSDEDRRKNTEASVSKFFSDAKAGGKDIVAGGLLGAGFSIATGMIGGPLLGAAVGSAIGLARNSEMFNKALFGEKDKDGNYSGGLFGKKTSKFLNEKFPELAKSGFTGGALGLTGLIPGGPIGGMFLGAALKYVTSTDSFRNYMFGEEGLFGKDGEKKIKKKMLQTGIGAAAGLLVGPFGPIGNILLGSAIGFATDSEKLRKMFFGIEDDQGNLQGGILGVVRDKVIRPIERNIKGGMQNFEDYMIKYWFEPFGDLLKPLSNALGTMVNHIADNFKKEVSLRVIQPIAKRVNNIFTSIADFLGKTKAGRAVKAVGRGIMSIPKNIGKIPGAAVRKVGNAMTDAQVLKGTATNLSVKERLDIANTRLGGQNYATRAYDETAVKMSGDELKTNYDAIKLYQSTKANNKKELKKMMQESYERFLANTGFKTNSAQDRAIRKAYEISLKQGNPDAFNEALASISPEQMMSEDDWQLSDEDREAKLNEYKNTLGKAKENFEQDFDKFKNIGNVDELKKRADAAAKALGFKHGADKVTDDQRRLIDADIQRKKQAAASNAAKKEKADAPLGSIDVEGMSTVGMIHLVGTKIDDGVTKTLDVMTQIRDFIYKQAGYEPGKDTKNDENGSTDAKQEEPKKSKTPGAEEALEEKKDEPKAGDKKQEVVDGKVVTYVFDGKGNWEIDVKDKQAKEWMDEKKEETEQKNEFMAAFTGLGGGLGSLVNFLKGNKDGDEKGEKKSGGLFDILSGVAGIAGIFAGGGLVGKVIKTLTNLGKSAAGLASKFVGIAGAGLGVLNLFNLFGGKKAKEAMRNTEDELTGRESQERYDELGWKRDDYAVENASGNLVKNIIWKNQASKKILGTKTIQAVRNKTIDLAKAAANSELGKKVTGKASSVIAKAGERLLGSKVGQKVAESGVGKLAGKAFQSVAKDGVKGSIKNLGWKAVTAFEGTSFGKKAIDKGLDIATSSVTTNIVNAIKKVFNAAMNLLGKGAAANVDEVVEAGAEELAKQAGKSAGKSALKFSPINLAFIASAALTGWRNAKFMLEITEEPSIPEKLLSAVICGINEAIPVIGGVIPSNFVIKVLMGILDTIGMAPKDLMRKRKAALETLAEYNANNNDHIPTVTEYLRNVLHLDDGGLLKSLGKGAIKVAEGLVKAPVAAVKKVGSFVTGLFKGKDKEEKKEEAATTGSGSQLSKNGSALINGMAKDARSERVPTLSVSSGTNTSSSFKTPANTTMLGQPYQLGSGSGLRKMIGGASSLEDVADFTQAHATSSINGVLGKIAIPDFSKVFTNVMKYMDPEKKKDMGGLATMLQNIQRAAGDSSVGNMMTGVAAKMLTTMMLPMVTTFRSMNTLGNLLTGKTSAVGGEATEAVNKMQNETKKGGFVSKAVGWFTGLFNKEDTSQTGAGSGVHVSQRDPNYAGKKFGSSTIGQNGCGPAVAATVLRSYGRNADLDQTAGFAAANGYVAGASGMGTRASYFSDILGRNGIRSQYTSSKDQIRKAIGSGTPTILLGKDGANKSKANSPFGPNPHYIVARGTDRRGNVLVDDPELGRPALYKSSILNKTKLGILTGGDSATMDQTPQDGTALQPTTQTQSTANGDYVGKYVKKYESGSKGSEMISDGSTDNGGVSFGSYQFPSYKDKYTTKGNLPIFWNKYYASMYPGVKPGDNPEFKAAWLDAVRKDPAKFFANEHEFVSNIYYTPGVASLKAKGIGDPTTYDRAAQEAIWSTAVQYGPESAASVFASAGATTALSPKEYITRIYDKKINTIGTWFKKSPGMHKGIRNRFIEEKEMLLGLAGQKPIDPYGANGYVASTTGTNTSPDGSYQQQASNGTQSNDLGSALDNAMKTVFGGVLSKMGSMGQLMANMFGFNNPTNTGTTQDGSTYQGAVGNAAFNPGTGSTQYTSQTNPQQETAIVNKMREMYGWLGYSMTNRADFKRGGWSDCSGTVGHAIKEITGKHPGGYTEEQMLNASGRTVDENIGNGPNEYNLRPGDLLFYARPTSDYTKGRKDRVGHVEMYVGNGKRAGHGGGTNSIYGLDSTGHGKGPREDDLSGDAARYLRARRFTEPVANTFSGTQNLAFTDPLAGTQGVQTGTTNTTAINTGNDPLSGTQGAQTGTTDTATLNTSSNPLMGTGSGIIDFASRRKYSDNDITRRPINHEIGKVTSKLRQIGGDSDIGNTGDTDSINLIIKYLSLIAENTSANVHIRSIVDILQSIMKIIPGMSANVTTTATVAAAQTVSELNGGSSNGSSNTSGSVPEDTSALDAEIQNVLVKLRQLAQAV